MICVMTRFDLKYFWHLMPTYMMYRAMRRDLKRAPGLIRYAFLVQSPSVCFTVSIWASSTNIGRFSPAVPGHVPAARWAKRHCRHIWSGYWQLNMVSTTADQWPGDVAWPPNLARDTHLDVLASIHHEMEGER